jgi:hypothetical protein
MYNSGLRVVGRLIVDPFTQNLYSTNQEDFRVLKQARDSGKTLEEAVEELTKQKNKKEKR